jgi:hypothetical protein
VDFSLTGDVPLTMNTCHEPSTKSLKPNNTRILMHLPLGEMLNVLHGRASILHFPETKGPNKKMEIH